MQVKSAFSSKESVQREVKATLSQRATLSCEVAESKTDVKWYKDGKLLTSTKAIHTEASGKNRQLVIQSLEKKDAGEYVCEAGAEKLVFKIHVEGRIQDRCVTNIVLLARKKKVVDNLYCTPKEAVTLRDSFILVQHFTNVV